MPRPGAGGSEVYFGKVAPLQPDKGDFWYDTSATTLNFHNGVAWLAVAVSAGALDVISNAVSVLSAAVSVVSQNQSALSNAVSVLSDKVSVLSNSVSVLSQAVSVLSQAQSALSQAVSVLSQSVSVLSNSVSVLSNAVSVISQQVSVLSQAHSVLSQAFSVVSANIGLPAIKVVGNAQVISGTTTTQISGLSLALGAAAVYQYDARIHFNMSVADAIKFNISGTTSAGVNGAGRFICGTGVSGLSVTNYQAFPGEISATIGTTSAFICEVAGLVKTSAAFTLALFAYASAAAKDINIKAGSYLRAFKIG